MTAIRIYPQDGGEPYLISRNHKCQGVLLERRSVNGRRHTIAFAPADVHAVINALADALDTEATSGFATFTRGAA